MENEKNLEEIQEEITPVEQAESSENTAPVEEAAAPAEEVAEAIAAAEAETAEAAEEVPAAEDTKAEEKKATPGKIAMVVAAIVVVIAVIAALLAGGKTEAPEETVAATETVAVEMETEPETEPTIPADGNPDDETCKGTYTVTDEEVMANAETVVATIGDAELTNGQLQVFYWMQVQNFLSSEYGSYMMYYGMLDYTQSLDTQVSAMSEQGTWQQFFLKEALNTWQNYYALADKAQNAKLKLSKEESAYLEQIEENLRTMAESYGMKSAEELLSYNVGAGASIEDYVAFQELLLQGNKYYDAEFANLTVTAEELEEFFAEHEAEYAESGITKESGDYVDVRHVLFTPKGGTTDETGATTYSDAEWAACEEEAQNILNAWTKGNCDEESFAVMANAYSADPGSNTNGGLYENVYLGQMVEEFENWCFDESRKPGHYGMVKTSYGYHLMYFVDRSPIWENYAEQDLISQKSTEMMQNLIAEYPMEVDYSAISLGYVNIAG